MSRLVNRTPSYRKHKASGQAIVTLNGEDVYLGTHGSRDSRREYDRVIGEWLARGRERPGAQVQRRVADVIKAYWSFAEPYYGADVGPGAVGATESALGILRRTVEAPSRAHGRVTTVAAGIADCGQIGGRRSRRGRRRSRRSRGG